MTKKSAANAGSSGELAVNDKYHAILLAGVSTAALAMMATPAASAQPAGTTSAGAVSEIIVTARKRQESSLNVPVIETAIPQEQIERMQLREVKDIASAVPGLLFGTSTGSGGIQPSLRGVGTTALDPTMDQTVSLNIDGMQFNQGLAYQSALFDLGQIEVLKGPQALFFGKASPGGVIAIRTADPSDRLEVIGRAGWEIEANEKRAELIVSGPVTDTLKLRLAGMYSEQDGYFKNAAIAQPGTGAVTPRHDHLTAGDNYTARFTALWTPTDNFDARLKGTVSHDRIYTAGMAQLIYCPDGTSSFPGRNFMGGEDCVKNRTQRAVDMDPAAFPLLAYGGVGQTRMTQRYTTLEMNYRPQQELTLTSQTGFYKIRSLSVQNAGSTTSAGPPFGIQTGLERQDFTQEFRLNSDYEGPLNFTAGAFYQDAWYTYDSRLNGNRAYNLATLLSKRFWTIGIKSYSAFGQGRWELTPQIELAAGVRYTDETRTVSVLDTNRPSPIPVEPSVPKIEARNWSPELTATYKPRDNITVFGSLKQAYKSGSFNIGITPTTGFDSSYGDEKVRGGELGFKSRLFERRLALDVATYYYKYTGLQVGVSEPIQGTVTPVSRVINAGAARTYGVEFQATYIPPQIDGLTLKLNGNYNDGKFTTLRNVPCYGGQMIAAGCNQSFNPATGLYTAQDLSGLPLTRAPDWQVNFGFDYEVDISHGMSLVFTNNNFYSSNYITALSRLPQQVQKSFLKTDLSVAIRGPEDRWELALIGKNITDELTSSSCSTLNAQYSSLFGGQVTGGTTRGPAGVDEVGCRFDRGREVWLRLTVRPFS